MIDVYVFVWAIVDESTINDLFIWKRVACVNITFFLSSGKEVYNECSSIWAAYNEIIDLYVRAVCKQ